MQKLLKTARYIFQGVQVKNDAKEDSLDAWMVHSGQKVRSYAYKSEFMSPLL